MKYCPEFISAGGLPGKERKMKNTMKEVVVVRPHQVEVREVPVPVPGDDEVLIQMKAAGVCGSDHHIYHGANPVLHILVSRP